MSGELQISFQSNKLCYFLIRSRTGTIWNTANLAFETYATVTYSDYDISGTEQGTSGFYTATFPATITPGIYSIVAKQQLGGSVAESDPTIGMGDYQWNGTVTLPLSDLATSGQLSQVGPIKIYRGQMVQNFLFTLVSSADHISNFTSGIVSGQVSRDGANFGALQSGTVTEVGLGYYKVNLTSGDLLANTIGLLFTGVGVSGGQADQRSFSFVLQRSSGQN